MKCGIQSPDCNEQEVRAIHLRRPHTAAQFEDRAKWACIGCRTWNRGAFRYAVGLPDQMPLPFATRPVEDGYALKLEMRLELKKK